jgi:hypothetical protein
MSSSTESRERILGRLYNAQQYGRDAYIPQKKKCGTLRIVPKKKILQNSQNA